MEESFSLLDVTKLSIGDRQYTVSVGDKEAVSQLFYCYKDEKKGVIPGGNWQCDSDRLGRPFANSIVISEAVPTESAYADFDGVGHDLPPVKQLTGLKLRYLPPGAGIVCKKEEEKKETKEVKEKKEKGKKKKASKK